MTKPMRIAFFGSGEFGLPTLRALATSHTLVGVVTQPDKPAGRGTTLTPTPIAALAQSDLPSVPLLKPARCNLPEVVEEIHGWNADAWVVIAFGQKLGPALLDRHFAINLHASILPRWRGAAPINAAILAGDTHSGNSVITLADRMDAGEVLASSRSPIGDTETAGELHNRLSAEGPALVLKVLADFASGTLERRTQDESLVTLAAKLSRADGVIDLTQPAHVCARRINGLSPWPGVTISLFHDASPTGEPLKLCRARAINNPKPADPTSQQRTSSANTSAAPGTLIDATQGLVRCADGSTLQLIDVQPAGKRIMAWPDFARGRRLSGNIHLAHTTPTTKGTP